MVDNSEPNTSAFNEASFKMQRLHELQQRCNELREAPGRMSNKTGLLFCKMHSDSLQSLYLEISSKLSKEEKEEVKPKLLKLRDLTKKMNSCFNDYGKIKDECRVSFFKNKPTVIDLIFDVEELIRDYLDKHGFSTLNMESDEGDAYN